LKKFFIPAFVLSLALFLLFAIRGHWDTWKSDAVLQRTDDAYVVTDQIPLSTRITGAVHRVDVDDYQAVKAGQLILEFEDTDYHATTNEAAAAIDAFKAQLAANQSAKRAADADIDSAREAVTQAEAAVNSASALIDASQAQVSQAKTEYSR
jgi:membrane fusion protein, multidrug efflux system